MHFAGTNIRLVDSFILKGGTPNLLIINMLSVGQTLHFVSWLACSMLTNCHARFIILILHILGILFYAFVSLCILLHVFPSMQLMLLYMLYFVH